MTDATKIPHDPSRTVGRWAFSMGGRIFKVEEAYASATGAHYNGTALNGDEVRSFCITVLDKRDHDKLEELWNAGAQASM